jgi:hypothetical protein
MDDGLGARAAERDVLTGTLDWYRGVVENKLDGLADRDARRVMTASGLSPLGVVKHLTLVELDWFGVKFAGEPDPEGPDDDAAGFDDNAPTFLVDPDDTVAATLRAYRDATEQSRVVTTRSGLDDLSARATPLRGRVSLRWLLVHMLEETARHAGHLDLMREEIDGRTGD